MKNTFTEKTDPGALSAGVARVDITPPVGIRMAGYTLQECLSESIERPMTATSLVLADRRAKVALIACDILFIQSPHAERMRQRIGEALGIGTDHVLINASHTHLGPMLPGWHDDTPDQQRLQQRYLDALEEQLVGAAQMADRRLQPARIGAAKGSAPIGINRRERLPDGRVIIGENPDGAVDRDVDVIRVDDLAGRPIATVMTAAAHTIVLGPKTPQLSPDYVGPAREIVESATGAPSLFFQGAAGNVCPISGIGAGGPDQYDDLQRVGMILAGEVLKTWSHIRTHNRRGPRRVVQSVAALSVWDYEPIPAAPADSLQVASRRITLPMAPLPERSVAETNLAKYRDQLEQARREKTRLGTIQVAQRLVRWAEIVLEAIDAGRPVTRDLICWAMRVHDIGIVAVNGEPFAELALEVKGQSPWPHTLFLGYSNGCLGYLPTAAAFDEGGMEVVESYQNYLLPAAFTRDWGKAVVHNSLDLLRSLHRG